MSFSLLLSCFATFSEFFIIFLVFQVIESDPEDEIAEPPMSKYARPDGSTPTYSMDTDISTLEAPTFTTLSHGPGSNNVLQTLKWDHPPTLIGTKESEKKLTNVYALSSVRT